MSNTEEIIKRIKNIVGHDKFVDMVKMNPRITDMGKLPIAQCIREMLDGGRYETLSTDKVLTRYKLGNVYFYDIYDRNTYCYKNIPSECAIVRLNKDYAKSLPLNLRSDIERYINEGKEYYEKELLEMIWEDNYYFADVLKNYRTKTFEPPLEHVAAKLRTDFGLLYKDGKFHRC